MSNFDELLETLDEIINDFDNKKKINKIENVEHKLYNENCGICLEKNDKNIVIIECNHKYHFHCLMELSIRSSSKCPLCRKEFKSPDIYIISNEKDKEIEELNDYIALLQNNDEEYRDLVRRYNDLLLEYSNIVLIINRDEEDYENIIEYRDIDDMNVE